MGRSLGARFLWPTVYFKLVLMMHNCLHHKAPRYSSAYCIPVSDVASRRHLHSARRHLLVVPRHSLSSYGRQTFAVAGRPAWNSLSDDLRDPTLITDSFRQCWKRHPAITDHVPATRTLRYSPHSFAMAGPSTWNSLPAPISSCHLISAFRRDLKTELFARAYHKHARDCF